MGLNACIVYISSRNKCIEHSLKSLWDNYNYKHNYPVYVHYFDDIYDDEKFRDRVSKSCQQKVIFRSVPYKTPTSIREEELFYNRRNLWYVNTSFSIHRKGYLHMCNFTSNMYGYENTELEKYDYIMTHDDESGYNKELDYDPFEVLSSREEPIGAMFVGQRLKNGAPHQGHLDCRVKLWQFTKKFIEFYKVNPKSEALLKLLEYDNAEYNFHFLEWCDSYIIKNEMFKSDLWKKWINAVNKSGGIYKYRWGDNEIISLFAHMYSPNIYNFKTVEEKIHNQGMFRHIQDYAPGVKDLER